MNLIRNHIYYSCSYVFFELSATLPVIFETRKTQKEHVKSSSLARILMNSSILQLLMRLEIASRLEHSFEVGFHFHFLPLGCSNIVCSPIYQA